MSLYENLDGCMTFTAGADLSTAQYKFVKLNSSGQIILATAGDPAIGVLYDNPVSGAVGAVRPLDGRKTLVKAGAALATKGVAIAADATGRAKAAVLGATSSSYALGILVETAGAADDVVQFVAIPFGGTPTTNT